MCRIQLSWYSEEPDLLTHLVSWHCIVSEEDIIAMKYYNYNSSAGSTVLVL